MKDSLELRAEIVTLTAEIARLTEENEKYSAGMQENCQLRAKVEQLRQWRSDATQELLALKDRCTEMETGKRAERELSNAYVRLRYLIPGAMDTPHAPTPEHVYETTEKALEQLRADLAQRELAVEDLSGQLAAREADLATAREEEREACALVIEVSAVPNTNSSGIRQYLAKQIRQRGTR